MNCQAQHQLEYTHSGLSTVEDPLPITPRYCEIVIFNSTHSGTGGVRLSHGNTAFLSREATGLSDPPS